MFIESWFFFCWAILDRSALKFQKKAEKGPKKKISKNLFRASKSAQFFAEFKSDEMFCKRFTSKKL
jgi:hypothetical protein